MCPCAGSPPWVKAHAGLSELQLRFLLTSCLAGACPAALAATLAAGCRALARPFSMLATYSARAAHYFSNTALHPLHFSIHRRFITTIKLYKFS